MDALIRKAKDAASGCGITSAAKEQNAGSEIRIPKRFGSASAKMPQSERWTPCTVPALEASQP